MNEAEINNHQRFFEENNFEEIINLTTNLSINIWEILEKEQNLKTTALHILSSNKFDETLIEFIKSLKLRPDYCPIKLEKYINLKNEMGFTALHFLSYHGFIQGIKLLIENGADINQKNIYGLNVLHIAAQANQNNIIVFFKEKYDFDINCLDNCKSTPLHWACYTLSNETIQLLLAYNALINAQDNDGSTPLHVAISSVKGESICSIKRLLYNGANINIFNKNGDDALRMAMRNKKHQIVSILERKDENFPFCNTEFPIKKYERNKKNIIIFTVSHFVLTILVLFLLIPIFNSNLFLIAFSYFTFFVIEILVFTYLVYADPGRKENSELKMTLLQVIENNESVNEYCEICVIKRESDTRHCVICDVCIHNFDHHCFWINNCIGDKNKYYYLIFVFIEVVYLIINLLLGLFDLYNVFAIGNTNSSRLRHTFSIILICFCSFLIYPVLNIFFYSLKKVVKPNEKAKVVQNI